jgi:hypothetical protein
MHVLYEGVTMKAWKLRFLGKGVPESSAVTTAKANAKAVAPAAAAKKAKGSTKSAKSVKEDAATAKEDAAATVAPVVAEGGKRKHDIAAVRDENRAAKKHKPSPASGSEVEASRDDLAGRRSDRIMLASVRNKAIVRAAAAAPAAAGGSTSDEEIQRIPSGMSKKEFLDIDKCKRLPWTLSDRQIGEIGAETATSAKTTPASMGRPIRDVIAHKDGLKAEEWRQLGTLFSAPLLCDRLSPKFFIGFARYFELLQRLEWRDFSRGDVERIQFLLAEFAMFTER